MSSKLVFITGATGFIGAQVLDAILQAGYRTRVSVRKSEQIQTFKDRYPSKADQLEFAVVPNISDPGCFVDALKGVDSVIHLASPMPGKGDDLKTDYVDPAVKGTEGILIAASQHPSVKTVIVEASVLSLTPVNVFTLSDVSVTDNTGEVIPVDPDMKFPPNDPSYNGAKYTASKILAHQASRDWAKDNSHHFKLITFHPVFVLGPDLNQTSSSNVGSINAMIWKNLGAEKPPVAPIWVHVLDLAEAHVRALEAGDEIASGTEFILSAPPFEYEDAIKYIKSKYPEVDLKWQAPLPAPWKIDTTTANTKLDMQWRDWKVIVDDVFKQQIGFQNQ